MWGGGLRRARSPSRPARGAEHDRICLTELVPGGTLSTLSHLRLLARRPLAGPASLTSRTNGPDLVRKRVTWSRSPRLPPALTFEHRSKKGVPMGFNVTSSTGQPLSEEA